MPTLLMLFPTPPSFPPPLPWRNPLSIPLPLFPLRPLESPWWTPCPLLVSRWGSLLLGPDSTVKGDLPLKNSGTKNSLEVDPLFFFGPLCLSLNDFCHSSYCYISIPLSLLNISSSFAYPPSSSDNYLPSLRLVLFVCVSLLTLLIPTCTSPYNLTLRLLFVLASFLVFLILLLLSSSIFFFLFACSLAFASQLLLF